MNNQYLMSDEEEPHLMGDLTPGTSQQLPPVPPPQTSSASPVASLPTTPAHQVTKPGQVKLPGMPAGVTPDDLMPYLSSQKASLQKFGPDQQMELEKHLMDQRNSLGYKVADAGKGFADALMQGVARAGNPGWQKQFEDQNLAQGQEQMGVMQKAHEQQVQGTQANLTMDMMDAKSAISKTYQQAAVPVFQQMGISAAQVAHMPASQVETIATLGLKSEDIKMQGEIKQLLINLGEEKAKADIKNKNTERAQVEQKLRTDHPILNMVGMLPKLDEGAGSTGNASTASGPYGSTVKRNGKTYEWSPVSKQYHPVK